MDNKTKAQARGMIERAKTQEDLVAILMAYTEAAKTQTSKPAKFQEATLQYIEEIAVEKGQIVGLSLGATIMVQQHHKIAQWGDKAFCLSRKQVEVIVRENWNFLKSCHIQIKK